MGVARRFAGHRPKRRARRMPSRCVAADIGSNRYYPLMPWPWILAKSPARSDSRCMRASESST